MTLHATLQVEPIRAQLRGDDSENPVLVGTDGPRVVLVADGKHAELLAKMIARVTGDLRDVDDLDPVLWDHVIVDLLASKAMATGVLTDVTPRLEVVR